MTRRNWLLAVMAVAAVLTVVAVALLARPGPMDITRSWVDARNRGDVDAAMAYLGETGNIFGVGVHLPGQRERLREILEAQTAAGYVLEDFDCRTETNTVTCRYVQHDRILDAWDVALAGEHRYTVRDGRLVRADRTHDPASQAAAYAVFEDFRLWIRDRHPELFDVIWVDRTSALYTTVAGAEAILSVLDEYQPPSN